MTNTINNVPRELLELSYDAIHALMGMGIERFTADRCKELRQILSAPSPAGVDVLDVVGYVSQDDIKWQGDCTLRLKPYSDYTIPLCRLSDAKAIIDGLRARCFSLVMNCAAELETASYCMTDEEAKRIAQSGADYYRKEARLSAGKEGE